MRHHVEHEFVVDLKHHLASKSLLRESAVDGNHRELDNVGRAALNRGVDGVAFSKSAGGGVLAVDIGQEAFAAE